MGFFKVVAVALAFCLSASCAFVTPSAFMGKKGGLDGREGARPQLASGVASQCSEISMVVRDVGSIAELDRIVKGSKDKLIVVDYSTTWCGPCKLILPKFEQLAEEYKDAVFLKVIGDSTNDASKLMKREGVRSVPSFHFWKGGKKVDSVNGANEPALEDTLRALA